MDFASNTQGRFSKDFQKALTALNNFDKYLDANPPVPDRMFAVTSLEASPQRSFFVRSQFG